MGVVKIRGLEISACHGVHDFEKTKPQRFVFDVDIRTDFYGAAKTDKIDSTINYSRACTLISAITRGNVFNLIEKLAYECAFGIMENFENASAVTLTVFKPDAPIKLKFGNVGVGVELRREKAYLSLGSSMGDKKRYLDTAVEKLASTRGVRVEKVSDYISTQPYGGVAENTFLNCAVCVETFLSPRELLEEIHRIEKECGRVRKERWGDRTLDIDIVFFGNRIIREEGLTVPHPDYANRQFVLQPMKQIAPDFVCPLRHVCINEL